ncbi:MAG TPA: hypothetical protein PKZ42_01880 [Syntrophales bacterium]|nr:hypothetical protein [Syntrophales bacterium]
MKKEMTEICVETDDEGRISITQPATFEDGDTILIYPDQVDILIKWLQEAKEEVLKR